MASSKSVVIAALIANGAIAILKFIGFTLTGSPAMLSETYHSISDTGNQVFLLFGIRYSGKEATRSHPFGYGKAQFFYAFLVSVLLFGIAGWESAKHGYHAILHPKPPSLGMVTLAGYEFPGIWVSYAVLIGAIVFETYALAKAYKAMKLQIEKHEWSGFREAFRKTSDVTTLTALTEDAIALAGAAIALVGIYLSRVTGNGIYDAVSAFLIGLMLMGFAIALAWENKRLLLGESLPEDAESPLRDIVRDYTGVTKVEDFRTVYFGPGRAIVTADVAFDPEMDTEAIDDTITAIEKELQSHDGQIKKVYIEPEVRGSPAV
ncbi:cation diffusion facilitator family transporter [Haloarchaeobius amylolyticus]|uniref:cation diffusion facilitator family transporter n=1 Tax=Haloarchaeobius amylolyticus TaxID=1198296 RepID=UPI00226FC6F1|nr:cation diffusion facilitator family transporter [Haloarchaeobius amylolyticus]